MDMSAWMEENFILPAFCLATPCGSSSLEWVSQPWVFFWPIDQTWASSPDHLILSVLIQCFFFFFFGHSLTHLCPDCSCLLVTKGSPMWLLSPVTACGPQACLVPTGVVFWTHAHLQVACKPHSSSLHGRSLFTFRATATKLQPL